MLDLKLDKVGGNLEKNQTGSKVFKNIMNKHKLIDCFRCLYSDIRKVTWINKAQSDNANNNNVDLNNNNNNNNNSNDHNNNNNNNNNDNNNNNSNDNNNNNKSNDNNYKNNYVGCRLDRFYISSLFKNVIVDCIIQPCTVSDHDFVQLKLNEDVGISFGKSYWKFNDVLLEDTKFKELFEYYWKIISKSDKSIQNSLIKEFCIDFSKQKNKKIYGEYKRLNRDFHNLNLNKNDNLQQQEEIKNKIKNVEMSLQTGSIIISKANILDSKENPSSYFFNKEKSHSLKKSIINIKHNDKSYNTSENILKCFREFYQELYSAEPVDKALNDIFLNNLPQVSFIDNACLSKPIDKEKIHQVLKQFESGKSPGSDGLTTSLKTTKLFFIF